MQPSLRAVGTGDPTGTNDLVSIQPGGVPLAVARTFQTHPKPKQGNV